jgi:hypothetical protein
MGRVSEPEVPRAASSTCAKSAKTPHPQLFGTAAAKQDRQERVYVNAGGRRSQRLSLTRAMGPIPKTRINPMERNTREPPSLRLTPRCGSKRRDGVPCQKPRARGRNRCRLHGGAHGSGAPKGEANGRYCHGLLTAEAIAERIAVSAILGRSVK